MTDAALLKREVCDAIDAMSADLLAVSHEIHGKPELAFHEHEAARILSAAVEKADLPVTRGAFGLPTAYVSAFGPERMPEVAILSEYDALPGIGHACGHNIIATTGLGAALALSKLGAKLPGRVRYLGTPAEEMGGGKELMAQEGAFDGVDAAMMVHPAGVDLITMPCICVSEVSVTYHGRSAHASAMPHMGLNALDALITAYQAIAQLRQHIKPTERIHGIIKKGGSAPNIVPDETNALFYVRAANAEDLAPLKKRVQACFEAGALASGCTVDIKWAKADYLDLKTSMAIADAYEANARSLGRDFFPLSKMPAGSSGSTDMGNVSHRVPSIHPMIASAPPHVVIHNPEFAKWAASDLGDKACIDGAKALAMTAIDYMTNAEMREKAKADFAATAESSARSVAAAYDPSGSTNIGGCGCM
ncbi:M20 family metallopeptidase [Parvibaculum sp.]|uniref:M20 family metallopeptidase n=1 Tax=Parvibaculum sp. TaxID=2024848 RepID=UPI001B1D8173|nr:M20 family metallopeptidase [Parvibaculum sp.]MBO6669742.1 M20 family metallopeptidase [Parvibaculum sp.]MBO6693532.1 M20 family metallopeptidase [Parvibaculum sp.]MBO6716245.1 M20 family metallopeptidase [Parvibaculum sp.]